MAYIGVSPSNGVRRVHTYTVSGSSTDTFSGAGAEGTSLSYKDSNFVDVYQNGVKLADADYTATSGTSIVLGTTASDGDIVVIVTFDVFSVADTVSKADGGTFDGNVTMAGTLSVTGNQTNSGSVTITGDLVSSTSGTSNFRAGVNAGNSITSGGNENVLIGDEAGTALTTGDNNVAVGFEALKTEDTHGNNVAVGYQALKVQDAGDTGNNVAVGYQAGAANTTGQENTFIGSGAGKAITTGHSTVAVGAFALDACDTGNENTAVGAFALSDCTDGHSNTAVGQNALADITTGVQNVAVGIDAGRLATTGANGVYIGIAAGGGATLTGNNNVCVGNSAGSAITSGGNNVALGQDALRSGSPGGAQTSGSNKIGLGDASIGSLNCQVSLSAASDERDKTDFTPLDIGLDFVNDLKPYTYRWDKRIKYGDKTAEDYDWSTQVPDGTHKEDWLDVGFKAQEVEVLEKAKGYNKDNKTNLFITAEEDGKQYAMRYEKFVPLLVKAMQELSAKNDALEARIKTLEGG